MSDILALARPEIIALKAYESARSLVAGAPVNTVFLDANESPFGERGLNRYPEPQPRALVERLSQLYAVAPENLVIGRGSDEAIDLLIRAFCRPDRDSILICPPTYGVYELSAAIQGAKVIRVPLEMGRDGEPRLDQARIAEALSRESVKLVFLCSPNNPTGTAFSPDELSIIAEQARGRALVVVDEAYAEFSSEESMIKRLTAFPNLAVLRTLSKAWALAGARCGSVIGSPELAALLHKVRAPYPLALPAVEAVLEATREAGRDALADRVHVLCRSRDRLARELGRLAEVTHLYASSSNFLLARFRDSDSVMRAAREAGIILRDRSREAGLEGCVRITVGTDRENEAMLASIRRVAT